MAHFRANTCESCKHYDGEHYMDGPAICSLHKLLIWPGNRGCRDYKFLPVVGRGYSREEPTEK